MLSGEVVILANALQDLVDGHVEKKRTLANLEPIIKFIIKKHCAKMHVYLWDGPAPTLNKIVLDFYDEHVQMLLYYLQLVTGRISESDERIAKMISSGCLLN